MFLRICFGATVLEGYGLSESSSGIVISDPEDYTAGRWRCASASLACCFDRLLELSAAMTGCCYGRLLELSAAMTGCCYGRLLELSAAQACLHPKSSTAGKLLGDGAMSCRLQVTFAEMSRLCPQAFCLCPCSVLAAPWLWSLPCVCAVSLLCHLMRDMLPACKTLHSSAHFVRQEDAAPGSCSRVLVG